MRILGYIETTDQQVSGSIVFHPVESPYTGSIGEHVKKKLLTTSKFIGLK